ncbi:MAG: hypothetical protein ABSE08_05750 [Syntrophobacteraceae bacterium]
MLIVTAVAICRLSDTLAVRTRKASKHGQPRQAGLIAQPELAHGRAGYNTRPTKSFVPKMSGFRRNVYSGE